MCTDNNALSLVLVLMLSNLSVRTHTCILQVFDGDKKSEQPGAEELALLVEIFRNRAAHPSVEIEKKCEVLERCLECIQDLSSR